MEALKKIAQQNITPAPSSNGLLSSAPAQDPFYASALQGGLAQQPPLPVTQSQPTFPFPAAPPPVNPAMPYAYPQQAPVPGQNPLFPQVTASSQPSGFLGAAPAAPTMPGTQAQVQLIQLLAQQGVPPESIPTFLAALQSSLPAAQQPPVTAPQPGQLPYSNSWGQDASRPGESRDRHDYGGGGRSPNRYHNRSRSRSPRHWESRDSPRGRGYGSYSRDSPAQGRDDRAGWGGATEYRQRSPAGRRGHSPSPPQYDRPNPVQKWIEFDRTLPSGHIKVLSRTLFVGGVTCSEAELRSIFTRHGQVQTCIVNKDKRHAFVKMMSRRDAVAAKDAMENSNYRVCFMVPLSVTFVRRLIILQTRWGVGFGPRDCSDYSTGISVIPINKLTEADRKWMLTADFGGSGGRPIETGLVVEEPDIEIGAGVSSKAISRRMQTDRGGKHGPKSSRGGGGGGGGNNNNNNNNNNNGGGDDEDGNISRWRRNKENRRGGEERHDDRNANANANVGNNGAQPIVPDFPYGISTGPNGMPVFPPGFTFPAPGNQ
jgi:protein NRD1